MSANSTVRSLGWPASGEELGQALDRFLDSRVQPPRLLGLGEPVHGFEVFPLLRNRALRHLVERRGYRSVTVESDCLAAAVVDDYVTSGAGELDEVLASGFSHGFGDLASTRDLVTWLRDRNREREPTDRIRFYGCDAPTEFSGAPSPRAALAGLHGYLAAHLEPARIPHAMDAVDALVGDEEHWASSEAMMEPTRSVGRSAAARELRVIADDLLAVLESESPALREGGSADGYERAWLYARTAQGLLRYHAVMAGQGPDRLARLLAARDAMMAGNLLALAAAERGRGPSLVFAHNQHLRRDRSAWQLEEMDLRWWNAGAIAATHLGTDYAVVAADLGAAPDLGVPQPEPDTLQAVLAEATEDAALLPADALSAALREHPALAQRAPTPPTVGYLPLAAADLDGIDALAFVRDAAQPHVTPAGGR